MMTEKTERKTERNTERDTEERAAQQKRLPIRNRMRTVLLLTALFAILVTSLANTVSMLRIRGESEAALTLQTEQNILGIVEQKAVAADVRLEHYEKYIEFLTDYIEAMYVNRDILVGMGTMFDFPRFTTGEDEYAITALVSSAELTLEDVEDEVRFFSNLERVWDPIARENADVITTLYCGDQSGLLTSYDRWSYLSAVPEGEPAVYDYFDSEWYQTGMTADGVFFTGLYVDSQGRGLTITVAEPYRDTDGVVRGVNCADFDITGLYDEMIQTDVGAGALSFAIDGNGRIISPDAGEVSATAYTGLSEEELQEISLAGRGVLEKESAFYVYAPVDRVGWTLCTRVPRAIIMDDVREVDQTIWTTILVAVIITILTVLVIFLIANRVSQSITHPITLLEEDMECIAGGDLDHRAVAYRNDELGDMAERMNEMVDRLKKTLVELEDTQQHAVELNRLATRDSLTGIRNKTAYDNYLKGLNWEFAGHETQFGFVMIDLNFLKRINDTYGHEYGNYAIRKICRMICDTFVHSPVFRIGGDEFVVVLKGKDYEDREHLTETFKERVEAEYSNEALEPWERVSAAIGCAVYDERIDTSVDNVFRRADNAMYEHKREMKATRE